MNYSQDADQLLRTAFAQARRRGHSYVGSEHILLAMLECQCWPGRILCGAGLDPVVTGQMASLLYGVGTASLPLPQGFTQSAKKILHSAGREAARLGSKEVDCTHLLLAMLRCRKTAALELLYIADVDADEVFTRTVDYLQWRGDAPAKQKKEAVSTKLLEQFSEDLILKASGMEPVVGRDREIEMVIGILSRKNKNNPALIGEPGVGKTAIAEGLA